MSGPAVLAIVNPVAARGAAARLWRQVEAPLRARFESLAVRVTGAPGDAETWAREWSLQYGRDGTVIGLGGDGTVHEIVNGLLNSPEPSRLGIIPAGTGNDFARNTGLPLDARAALERLAQDRPEAVDCGRIRYGLPDGARVTRVFVNSASVGVSPKANRIAGSIRRVLPGRISYALGGVLALFAEGAGEYLVTAEDRTLHAGRALNITLANGAHFGGGMRISPASSPRDGVLDMVTIGDIGRGKALLALSRLYAGTHIRIRGVTVAPVTQPVQIERSGAAMLVEADGEDRSVTGLLSVEPLPGALRLL